jgi:hypothetical protein
MVNTRLIFGIIVIEIFGLAMIPVISTAVTNANMSGNNGTILGLIITFYILMLVGAGAAGVYKAMQM